MAQIGLVCLLLFAIFYGSKNRKTRAEIAQKNLGQQSQPRRLELQRIQS
jgi:Mg2+/citrate symporter